MNSRARGARLVADIHSSKNLLSHSAKRKKDAKLVDFSRSFYAIGDQHFFLHDPNGKGPYKQTVLAQIAKLPKNPSSPFLLMSTGNTKAPYHLDRARKNADALLKSYFGNLGAVTTAQKAEVNAIDNSL